MSSIPPSSQSLSYLSQLQQMAQPYYERATTNIPSKICKIALPVLAVVGLSSIPSASAGPITYASCMAGCAALSGPFVVGCWAACLPLLGAPTP